MEPTFTEFAHLKIPLEEILEDTNNFAEKKIIGKGGFGNAYKGKITRSGKSIKIVARRLGRNQWQGDAEFWTEISMLSILKHENIVSLVGYCDEKGEKIIINRLYAKGSLVTYLSDPSTLSWYDRMCISHDVASAIHNIHNPLRGSYYIIHRNINFSTIVLDNNFNKGGVRLSGFEHSIKRSNDRKNQVYLCETIGTKGYIDPAIETAKGVTHKSDIYSFGVVLFEMLCGKKAFQDGKFLAPLAKYHYEKGTLGEIIHPDLWDQMELESFKFFTEAAYSCLHEDPTKRPEAYQLYDKLQKAIQSYYIYSTDDEIMKSRTRIQRGRDKMLESYLPCTYKVKNLEHLRIEVRDVLLAPNFYKGFSSPLNCRMTYDCMKTNLVCFNRECRLFLKGLNIDELPKKRYTVMAKSIDTDYYHEKYGEEYQCTEIEILSSCDHENIVRFLGYSEMYSYVFLIYEFVSNRCLFPFLDSVLTWETRLKICIDVAHGLNYLHNEMEGQKMVIHRNINSENILLDDNWRAKIVEFGRSVFLPSNIHDDALYLNVIDSTNVYMDPEYFETGKLKRESDVYSFGVVMLEILCGMSAKKLMDREGGNDKGLAHLARRWLDEGIIKRMVNPQIKGENADNTFVLNKGTNEDFLDTFIAIMDKCLKLKQNQRPTMQVVIKELEKALSFQENNKDTLRLSFQDIKSATDNFTNCIGGGGFGGVFKGNFSHGNGTRHTIIVAKKLDKSRGQGEKQFYNELRILCEYKHDNVIRLVGYSDETEEKIIVLENASNGSLDKHLNNARLTWHNRLKICIDVAVALDFLHGGVEGQDVVLHRDIKTANVLLFDDWKAKLSDFGLSLISTINKDSNYAIDHACGTKGYVDDSYLKSSTLTMESEEGNKCDLKKQEYVYT